MLRTKQYCLFFTSYVLETHKLVHPNTFFFHFFRSSCTYVFHKMHCLIDSICGILEPTIYLLPMCLGWFTLSVESNTPVEQHTSIAKVIDSKPVVTLIFFFRPKRTYFAVQGSVYKCKIKNILTTNSHASGYICKNCYT